MFKSSADERKERDPAYARLEKRKRLRLIFLSIGLAIVMSVFWIGDDFSHFEAIDTWTASTYTVPGKVVSTSYIPAHNVTKQLYNAGTHSYWPQSFPIPDVWLVKVAYAKTVGDVEVSQDFYQQVRVGTDVKVSYTTGLMTGWMYVKAVALPNGQ